MTSGSAKNKGPSAGDQGCGVEDADAAGAGAAGAGAPPAAAGAGDDDGDVEDGLPPGGAAALAPDLAGAGGGDVPAPELALLALALAGPNTPGAALEALAAFTPGAGPPTCAEGLA